MRQAEPARITENVGHVAATQRVASRDGVRDREAERANAQDVCIDRELRP